ncbi:MAG: UDP-N-acetylglucosamine 2-epimerase [Acidimicrobiia bacterium]|nr:UDP-N-acetylglucosamine 2-epimerase [Acidimicrobiia bacterium]
MTSIVLVTGARADYDLLTPIFDAIEETVGLSPSFIVTGNHLSEAFGHTANTIISDGYRISAEVPILDERDDSAGVASATGRAVEGIHRALITAQPDLMLLLGDRYETLAAALAASIARIPIAHIAGGDETQGAFDDAFRHAITKLSHLHFTTNAMATRRIVQMGEDPNHVFTVGSPGLDRFRSFVPMKRDELLQRLGLPSRREFFVATYHPETLALDEGRAGLNALLEVFEARLESGSTSILITGSNADPAGREFSSKVKEFSDRFEGATYRDSLGGDLFPHAVANASCFLGNSSAGLYEAPSLGTPTVDIGLRQAGRLRAESVFAANPSASSIIDAIDSAIRFDMKDVVNPYGDGHASNRIAQAIADIPEFRSLLKKQFRFS